MQDHIDYFFTTVSPFAWLGHRHLMALASKHEKSVRFRPVNLGEVFANSGSVPLAQRSAVRQRYRLVELQRIALMRGVHLNPQPAHFPTNSELADRTVIALAEAGRGAADFAQAVGEAVWSLDLDIADEVVLARLLEETGHDAAHFIEAAKSQHAADIRLQNTKDAMAADAIGSPSYVYKGEVFWGQDRIDLLDHMIETGREPFRGV
jgi:2-hydroxychromene-2-carboxylate isomerase